MRFHPYNNSFGGPAVAEVVASVEVAPTAGRTSSAGFLVDPAAAREDGITTTAASAASLPRTAPERAVAVASAVLNETRGHRHMFAPDPIVEEAVTAEDYRQAVRKARTAGKGLVLMFYSAWCPHCFTYKKTFSQLAMDLRSRFHFAALNCMEDENTMDICGNLGIFALPSIKLFVPSSLHLQLPASEQQPKQATALEGNLHLEFPGMHDGGALDSFDASQPETVAIHSLALPSDDIYLAVQYAARKTQQQISKNELRLTLGGEFAAFEHLRGTPCGAYRWRSEHIPALVASDSFASEQEEKEGGGNAGNSSPGGDDEPTSGGLAQARLYDGIRGLQFILASWVVTEKEHMSFDEMFALVDLLEIVRAVVPVVSVKRAAALAIIHLQNSMQVMKDRLPLRQPETHIDESARFSEYLELYREIDGNIHATRGLRTADWRKWIGSLAFGTEALPLPPLEEPRLKHCTTVTCSVWMLMHLLAEGASELSVKVNAHPKCGPGELFFKRKGHALPIYLLQQQQQQQRPIDLDQVIDTASLSTEALIERNPSLGCMSVPAFEVAYGIYNFLQRFFGCNACRQHFTLLFSKRSHGLDALSPPAGDALIRLPLPVDMAALKQAQTELPMSRGSDSSLLEDFRGQRRDSRSAWANRQAEARKMDELKLWLWRLHNAVTVRTAADTTLAFLKGDGEAVNYANCDTRWPPRAACTSCRDTPPPETGLVSIPLLLARDADKDILAMEEEFGDFNKAQILTFLRRSYWPDDAKDMRI